MERKQQKVGHKAMSKGPPYLSTKLQAVHYLFWCISLMIDKGRDGRANYSKEIFTIQLLSLN
jgi:hypothetical protein